MIEKIRSDKLHTIVFINYFVLSRLRGYLSMYFRLGHTDYLPGWVLVSI